MAAAPGHVQKYRRQGQEFSFQWKEGDGQKQIVTLKIKDKAAECVFSMTHNNIEERIRKLAGEIIRMKKDSYDAFEHELHRRKQLPKDQKEIEIDDLKQLIQNCELYQKP